jgi:hypothetical protein
LGVAGGSVAGRCVGAIVGGVAGRGVAVRVGAGVDEGTGFAVSVALRIAVEGIAVAAGIVVGVFVKVERGSEVDVGSAISGDCMLGADVGDDAAAVGVTTLIEIVREAVSWPGTGVGEPSAELFIWVTPAATTNARTSARVSTPPIALLGVDCCGVEGSGTRRGVVMGAALPGTRVVGSRARPHRAHASRPAFIGEWHRGHTWGESMKLQ